ncbi:hypothetical protein WN51_13225 [Melipona quadrifasciata]|uniref:Uncharacterized protein n=1 Tax=Melipona quadrifasciata TaxID=166423 RepID=A0A0M9A1D8_9HYME|nr:hypothetical protein WN51_13225 [Melipona quadrifasciata]
MYVKTKNTDGSSFQRMAKGSSVKRKRSLSASNTVTELDSTCTIMVLRQYSLNYKDTSPRKRVYQRDSIATRNFIPGFYQDEYIEKQASEFLHAFSKSIQDISDKGNEEKA